MVRIYLLSWFVAIERQAERNNPKAEIPVAFFKARLNSAPRIVHARVQSFGAFRRDKA